MLTLALAVLAASLLGSVHCAAMCGAFTCLYAGPDRSTSATAHTAYHLGRLGSYLMLGLLAGTIGAGLGGPATLVSGVLLLLWGGHALLRARGLIGGAARVPAAWQRAMGAVVLRANAQPPVVRAATVGLATTLLPCGWMWAYVAVAAGTGSPGGAVVVMTVFWVGTLPMMIAVAAGAHALAGRYRTQLPVATAVAVMALGAVAIALHLGLLSGGAALHELLPDAPTAAGAAPHGSAH